MVTSTSTAFPAQLHAQKTVSKLHALLPDPDKSKAQIVYLQSQPITYRNDTDREYIFRQESNFFYLTGCDVPGSSLVLFAPSSSGSDENVTGEGVKTTLLIPPEDPLETMWSPRPPTLDEARELYPTHSSIAHTTSLQEIISAILVNYPTALVHTLPSGPNSPFPPLTISSHSPLHPDNNYTETYLLPSLHHARLIKTPHEIELIRKANAISSRAHELIMRLLGKHAQSDILGPHDEDGKVVMPGEWRIEREAEAEAAFVASCRREGSLHQAYLPIVAGAQRASTLHYCCNDRDFAWGPLSATDSASHDFAHTHAGSARLAPQVLLLDAGCDWKNYASDITRTTPVGNGGKFTKEAREMYTLVLKMQNDAIDSLKPGLHWDTVHYQCHVTLVKRFIELGIFVGTFQDVLDSCVSRTFFPHGLGHSLGLDVHDVPSASKPSPESSNHTIPELSRKHPSFYTYLRLRLPLEAGMVLTVEPGVYFSPHLLAPVRNSPFIDHEVLARYEPVGGIRIEDVLVITETGAENLTVVGKDVDWLEAVAGGRDV